jgi:UDP-N-acetylglucosamine 2-epimerase (non-hydrolysing)
MKTNLIKFILVAGARPNFMKIAPLMKAVAAHNSLARNGETRFNCRLVHTGQHYDARMSDIFFEELGIPAPDINLEVGSGSHAAQTANVMLRFETVCLQEKPDWVVVVGDVNSTMACTLVAVKMGVKVAHVEAGLRSFDRAMPEEINRLVTDALADLLLTPSEDADENLRREGVREERIRRVGNIMIDALIDNLPKARQSRILSALGIHEQQFVYVTLHRPSNVDGCESLAAILQQLERIGNRLPVVFPMHPRTRKMLGEFGFAMTSNGAFRVIEPVGYHDSLCLTENARLVLTDSGGLQEESTYFHTPCLTLRANTERPITISEGSNRLTNLGRLADDLEAVLAREPRYGRVPFLWDGRTADRVLSLLSSADEGALPVTVKADN